MTKQRLEADMGEAREEAAGDSWVARATAAPSPALSWEAVRAAIYAAGEGRGALTAQDTVKAAFFNLKTCDLAHANAALDSQIRVFESLTSHLGRGDKPEHVAAAIKTAKQTLNEVLLEKGAARAA